MKLSEFKEAVKNVLRERSINAISKLQQKNLDDISKALEYFKKNKHTDKKEPFIKLLKKLGKVKIDLAKELDMKVSGMYKDAEPIWEIFGFWKENKLVKFTFIYCTF